MGRQAADTDRRQTHAHTTYKTEQRQLVATCLEQNADRYQTVDEILGILRSQGSNIGRTTVYRTLERLSQEGQVTKVVGAPGSSAFYRLATPDDAEQGQLLCLGCGRVFPLDCSMLASFADHVLEHHGFELDSRRTVLCGECADCRRSEEENSEGTEHDGHEDSGSPCVGGGDEKA